ncbi:hypothetical protein [Acetobacterium bakii]|uniref:hypothetical protein n=1 Tax=Acetobacterium bakii TaxID=52689 RepID=UPI000E0E0B3C|nr:hypothetical protein [Acetobacterium bakii]
MNREFLKNMMLAKKYEKEAFMSLMSPTMAKHVDVIEKEVKAMIFELAKDWACDLSSAANASEDDDSGQEKKVKKVNIS